MRKRTGSVLVVIIMAVFCMTCLAQAATPDEAKALTEKAAAFVKANGKDKAVAEFNNQKGQFVKGDLYVFAQGFDGLMLANGGNPKLTGQNHLELKDPTGKFFVKEMVQIVKTKGEGWVSYSWTNPATKKVQPKDTYVKRVEGTDMFVGCGVFK
jgi:cytochrome c